VQKKQVDDKEHTDQHVRLTLALVRLVLLIYKHVFDLERELRELKKRAERDERGRRR
jgi:hypothetical protein